MKSIIFIFLICLSGCATSSFFGLSQAELNARNRKIEDDNQREFAQQKETNGMAQSPVAEVRERTPEELESENEMRNQIAYQNKKTRRAIGSILRGMGQAKIHAHDNEITCTTFNYGYGIVRTTCH